jgi:hypothetical protein
LQLALAAIWLLDGVLQLQPFIFTPGSHGFSGMLGSMASDNPGVVARTITWNASIVDHRAVVTNDPDAALIRLVETVSRSEAGALGRALDEVKNGQ